MEVAWHASLSSFFVLRSSSFVLFFMGYAFINRSTNQLKSHLRFSERAGIFDPGLVFWKGLVGVSLGGRIGKLACRCM